MVAELGTKLRNASAWYIVSVTSPDRRTLKRTKAFRDYLDKPFTTTEAASCGGRISEKIWEALKRSGRISLRELLGCSTKCT